MCSAWTWCTLPSACPARCLPRTAAWERQPRSPRRSKSTVKRRAGGRRCGTDWRRRHALELRGGAARSSATSEPRPPASQQSAEPFPPAQIILEIDFTWTSQATAAFVVKPVPKAAQSAAARLPLAGPLAQALDAVRPGWRQAGGIVPGAYNREPAPRRLRCCSPPPPARRRSPPLWHSRRQSSR